MCSLQIASHREKEDVLAEAGNCTLKLVHAFYNHIRELVDSLCRDEPELLRLPYKKKAGHLPNASF